MSSTALIKRKPSIVRNTSKKSAQYETKPQRRVRSSLRVCLDSLKRFFEVASIGDLFFEASKCPLLAQSGHQHGPFKVVLPLGTMLCLEPRGDNEATRFYQSCIWLSGTVATCGARAAADNAAHRFHECAVAR